VPQVKAHGPLTRRIGSAPVHAEGRTIREVVANLERAFPGFAADVLRPDGSARSAVRFTIGDRFVNPGDTVSADDLIEILTNVAGG
jgi:molybdopterin converting factor small subunit